MDGSVILDASSKIAAIGVLFILLSIIIEKIWERRYYKYLYHRMKKTADFGDWFIKKVPYIKRYAEQLEQSLFYLKVKKITAKNIISAQAYLILFSIFISLYFKNLYLLVPLAILFSFIPVMIVQEINNRAVDVYDEQILEFIQIFAGEFSATNSVIKALENTALKLKPPLKYEIERLLLSINSGISLNIAFEGLNNRVKNKWIKMMTVFIIMYYEKGGNLLKHIIKISEEIINEKMISQKNKTELATLRMANTVINVCMPLFLVLNFLLNPKGTIFFRETTAGKIAITVAVVFSLLSFILTQEVLESGQHL